MTATIIQLRDYQQPKDLARMYGESTLEQQAIGIVDYINGLTSIPYGGAGIDGMIHPDKAQMGDPGIYMTSDGDLINIGMDVTQANAFHAPADDPA